MARAFRLLFAPPVFVAIALSRLVDSKERKISKGGERRKGERRRSQR
jgi:hypothetical protein